MHKKQQAQQLLPSHMWKKNANASCSSSLPPSTPPCYWKYICHNLNHQKFCFSQIMCNHKNGTHHLFQRSVPKNTCKIGFETKSRFCTLVRKPQSLAHHKVQELHRHMCPFLFLIHGLFSQQKKKLKHLEDLDHPGWCGVKFIRRHNLSFWAFCSMAFCMG